MITRIWAVSQKILILVLVSVLACQSQVAKNEAKFLSMLEKTEFYKFEDEDKNDINPFSEDWKTITVKRNDLKYRFKLSKIYNEANGMIIGAYVFNTENEMSYYDNGQYVLVGFVEDLLYGRDNIFSLCMSWDVFENTIIATNDLIGDLLRNSKILGYVEK